MKSFLVISSAVLTVLINGCQTSEPVLKIQVKLEDGIPHFRITSHRSNGLLSFSVWNAENRELVWAVNLNYFAGDEVGYGELPTNFVTFTGERATAKQIFPAGNEKPKALALSTKYFLSIDSQYDSDMAPSVKTFYYEFEVNSKGFVSSIQPLPAIPPDKHPIRSNR